ncbi:MAG TPA: thioesterase family protein [Chitinophagaceae bacterium]|nr:thioesterase family protein [Chitinophagaceae bacterium]
MARIKIDLPDQFSFSVNIPVRITDINYGGHLGNDSILSLLHEARVKFINYLGFTELDVAGAGLIMADVGIEFKSESFYGDILAISVAAGEFSKIGFEIFYKIETIRNGKTILIAKAKTGMVCYDYNAKKIVAVPEELIKKFLWKK